MNLLDLKQLLSDHVDTATYDDPAVVKLILGDGSELLIDVKGLDEDGYMVAESSYTLAHTESENG